MSLGILFFFMINLRFITYGIRAKVTTLGLNGTTIVLSIYFVLDKKKLINCVVTNKILSLFW